MCITNCDTLPFVAEPMALRLDAETRAKLARIARRRKETMSGVIRKAVAAWVEREEAGEAETMSGVIRKAVAAWVEREEAGEAPWMLVSDLAGCVDGGDPDRASRGGRRVAELMRARRR